MSNLSITLEVTGLFAIRETTPNIQADIHFLSGPPEARHTPVLAIPSDEIDALAGPGSPYPRATLPGCEPHHLFQLQGSTELGGFSSVGDSYDLTRLVSLRDVFAKGGGGSYAFTGGGTVLTLKGGSLRTFATEPFAFEDIHLTADHRDPLQTVKGWSDRADNVVEWHMETDKPEIKIGETTVSLKEGAHKLALYCLPSSASVVDEDLGHFAASYDLLATPPRVRLYPFIPSHLHLGFVIPGYGRCVPPVLA